MKRYQQHGTRSCYFHGKCRCAACSEANAAYQRSRRKDTAPRLVPRTTTLRHLRKLSKNSVGRRAVAEVTGLNDQSLGRVRSGKRKFVQRRTQEKVLAVTVDAYYGNALVPAAPTWERLNRILGEGMTKKELARRLGSKAQVPQLQFKTDFVTARNEMRVRKFHDRMYHDHNLELHTEGDHPH